MSIKTNKILHEEFEGFHFRFLLAKIILSLIPVNTGSRLRSRFLRLAGFNIHPGAIIMDVPEVIGGGNIYHRLEIGAATFINTGCFFDLTGPIHIGNRVSFGPQVMLVTSTHQIGDPSRRAGDLLSKPIFIGDGAWLGARCTILPGVTIGDGAVVAAGAVVTKNVEKNTLVAGIPASVVKILPTE